MQIVNGGLTPSNPSYNIVSHHENLAIEEAQNFLEIKNKSLQWSQKHLGAYGSLQMSGI